VAAFLLACGPSDDYQRNELIGENHNHTGQSIDDLREMTEQQLVGLTANWFDWSKKIAKGKDELKQLFAAVPPRVLLNPVLSDDDWNALTVRLSTLTNQSPGYFRNLPTDQALIDRAVLSAFWLASGLRDSEWLKTKSDDWQRNDLIVENNKRTSIGELQGMTNRQLVGLTFEWFDWGRTIAESGDKFEQVLARIRSGLDVIPRSVLMSGRWTVPGKGYTLSKSHRTALIGLLRGVTYTAAARAALDKLTDAELISRGAVAAFLRASGMDKYRIKRGEGYRRNLLIEEYNKQTGRSIDELKALHWRPALMTNEELIGLTLSWFDWGKKISGADGELKSLFAKVPPRVLLCPVLSDDDWNALVKQLAALTNQSEDYFRSVISDFELIGKGAVSAFWLASGLPDRDRDWLKTKSDDEQRKELIAENNKKTGWSIGKLQGMTNQQLIGLTFEWFDWNDRIAQSHDALKQLFEVLPSRVLARCDWTVSGKRYALSGRYRDALVQQLVGLTNRSRHRLEKRSDAELIGRAGVVAFCLASGRSLDDGEWLKTKSDEDQRSELIAANNKYTGRSRDELRRMTDQELVGIGLEWFDWPKQLLGTLPDEDRQEIIREICALTGYRDTWMEIGERLSWVSILVSPLVEDPAGLAASLFGSVYPLFERHSRGLDYLGNGGVCLGAL
jgi:hypothetical protein